ncbi:MAG: nickel pincer cofactor biosynthesis protein LarB [Myxococcota bacterium]
MDSEALRQLFEAVRSGGVEIEEAIRRAAVLPFLDVEHARVDTHRALRQGIPEVVFGQGKTAEQILGVARALRSAGQPVLVTRIAPEVAEVVVGALPEAEHHAVSRTLWLGPKTVPIVGKGTILVVSAGSADRPVATEACEVARRFGNEVELLQDVGVAGIHRLFAALDRLRAARVLIVVAGMEGALPSVVGGLVDKPVIAVPTSVGYGASLGGVTALLGMLTSCASNVTVVNIDNGFGAAHVASLINRL